MIILITGTPGSGKSLYAVSRIVKWLKEGRTVYSDIDGLCVENVETSPNDWRTTPHGSVVIYDEAQQNDIFKKTKGVLSENQIIKDFEIHRHTGHDIVFITQSPKFLHSHILELVGEHYHLHRPYGASVANIYMWRMAQLNANTKTAKSMVETTKLFNYDKNLFKYYKSATQHTHKLRLPSKLVFLIALVLIAPFLIYWYGSKSHILSAKPISQTATQKSNDSTKSPNSIDKPDTPQPKILTDGITQAQITKQDLMYSHNLQVINYNPLLRVAGVIVSGNSCKAFNSYGEQLNLPYNDCYTASQYMTSGRTHDNDVRSNAHQNDNPDINQNSDQTPQMNKI
jgi:zona occludens toxin